MAIEIFSDQPPWLILLFFGIAPFVCIYAFQAIFKRIFKNKEISENDEDFLSATLAGLITLACITIGFAYSIAIGNLNEADSDLFKEATKIVNLNRLLSLDGSPAALEAKRNLNLYGVSIVQDEWPKMVNGQHSDKTTALIKQTQENINHIDPITSKQQSIFNKIISESQEVQELRMQRTLNTSMAIPPIFIKMTNLLILLIFMVSSILLIKASQMRKIALLLQSFVFSLFIAGIIMLDGPYSGALRITPDAIMKALGDLY